MDFLDKSPKNVVIHDNKELVFKWSENDFVIYIQWFTVKASGCKVYRTWTTCL